MATTRRAGDYGELGRGANNAGGLVIRAESRGWTITRDVLTFAILGTLIILAGMTYHYTCVAAINQCCVNNYALGIGNARGQEFTFEPTLAEGAQCRLSALATTESTDKNHPASCLECPCYPPNGIWTVDPSNKHGDINKLCPLEC